MTLTWPRIKSLVTTTVSEVGDDDVPVLAAAIAYYTVFSLPPLLVLLVGIAGAVLGPDEVARIIAEQTRSAIGPGAASEIDTMISNAGSLGGGLAGQLFGVIGLLIGATGAFAALQKALNRAWDVEDATEGNPLWSILLKRVLSLGMVLTVAFFLLVSLVVSAALTAVGDVAAGAVGGGAAGFGVQVLNVVVSLAIVTGLFAVLFKYLPDAEVSWRDVAVGGAVTAVLFTVGKSLIGIYLGQSEPGSAFGAAGSLALILIWVYYSALILLVGAEFTQVWAEQAGEGIDPDASGDDSAPGDRPSDSGADGEVHPTALPRDPAPY